MATITASSPNKIYSITQFYGLNENKDGDTKLKFGEASVCDNWRVTRDGNLQRRPGYSPVATFTVPSVGGDPVVRGLWCGYVNGVEKMLAACNGKLYCIMSGSTFSVTELGSITTSSRVFMFPFDGKVYFMNGSEYKQWDGTTFQDVVGYIPLVSIGIGPDDTEDAGGSTLEQINKLSLKRRAWISPNGSGNAFTLPESGMESIDYVKDTATGSEVTSGYTVDIANGRVTFTTAPAAGTNTYEIGWTMGASASARNEVLHMKFCEFYSGTTNNRVFIYGDGTSKILYSGLDYDGNPRADYFPDLNVIYVGESNNPVTALIRHQSKLICFKNDSAWSITYGTMTLDDSTTTYAYYASPINAIIGNDAPGQVMLIMNNPYTIFKKELYVWKSNNSYTGNLTADERQAKRVSDRIYATLGGFSFNSTCCWDDNANQEYYIVYHGTALVYNYAADAWYSYSNFDAICMCSFNGKLYFGNSSGKVMEFSESYLDDNGTAIDATWESGSISFGAEYMKKYSANYWISVKPQSHSYLVLSARTDRKETFLTKTLDVSRNDGFGALDFTNFSFEDKTMPQIKKLKMKAKKFAYYKIIFTSQRANTTATVLTANIEVRASGYAK